MPPNFVTCIISSIEPPFGIFILGSRVYTPFSINSIFASFDFFIEIIKSLNQNSEYPCMPTIKLYSLQEEEIIEVANMSEEDRKAEDERNQDFYET